MTRMSQTRWTLSEFLEARGISAYRLAQISEVKHANTVYRLVRKGNEPTRVDLTTLTFVIDGLRRMTGEDVEVGDILKFEPHHDPPSTPDVTEMSGREQGLSEALDLVQKEFGLSQQEMIEFLQKNGSKYEQTNLDKLDRMQNK